MGDPLDFTKSLELVCDGSEVVFREGPDDDGHFWLKRSDGKLFSRRQHPIRTETPHLCVTVEGTHWQRPTGPQIVRNRVENTLDAYEETGLLSTPAAPEPEASRFSIGDPVHVIGKREGQPRFPGYIIGSYTPLDGRHQGWVVEHERDGIVHVYADAQLAPGLGGDA